MHLKTSALAFIGLHLDSHPPTHCAPRVSELTQLLGAVDPFLHGSVVRKLILDAADAKVPGAAERIVSRQALGAS